MPPPANPKIYHIVHVDRLESIIRSGILLSHADEIHRGLPGTSIGNPEIKQVRLSTPVPSHAGLFVGDCVPFYFCPRSVMLFQIFRRNSSKLPYKGGQGPIVHLEADLRDTVTWANSHGLRWAFTLQNAGSRYFDDRTSLDDLKDLNWDAIHATYWREVREFKQAEYLIEREFAWELVTRIGVLGQDIYTRVAGLINLSSHKPALNRFPNWYY
jgi:hypothetical protein